MSIIFQVVDYSKNIQDIVIDWLTLMIVHQVIIVLSIDLNDL
jgi:hypothetical protein